MDDNLVVLCIHVYDAATYFHKAYKLYKFKSENKR